MKQLFAVLRRHAPIPIIVLAIVLGLVGGACNTGLIIVIKRTLFLDDTGEARNLLLARYVGLCVVLLVARVSSSLILAVLGARVSYRLRVDLCRRILSAPLRQLEELGAHRLMVTLTDDIKSISGALTILPVIQLNLAVVLGCLGYMAWISPILLAGVFLFIILGAAVYSLCVRAGVRRQALARNSEDHLYDHFKGVTQGTKELKIRRHRRLAFIEGLEGSAGRFRDLQIAAMKIFVSASNLGNLLFFIGIGFLVFSGFRFADLDRQETVGYALVLLYMLNPLQMILRSFPSLTQAGVAVRKVESLGLSLTDEIGAEPRALRDQEEVRLDLVELIHTYRGEDPGESFRLGPLNLSFRSGELVFLVGGNGSGKTTLAKVLMGLYLPEGGEIRYNGQSVTAETLEAYRQNFSVVFSDFFLFDRLLGVDSPDLDEKARLYLERLRLERKVQVTDGRFSTTALSQGQRKRLALLGSYLDDADIFVFDEWAADQDPEFKKVFYHQLLQELKSRGKLVLVISHDDAYYSVADRVIKLDYGQLLYDRPAGETASELPQATSRR